MFDASIASKLIELLQPVLDDETFAQMLTLIEENFTVDDLTATKDVVAMDRAIDRARRAPKRHQIAFDGINGLDRGPSGGRRISTVKADAELAAMASSEAA
jgi:hypothetical protein